MNIKEGLDELTDMAYNEVMAWVPVNSMRRPTLAKTLR